MTHQKALQIVMFNIKEGGSKMPPDVLTALKMLVSGFTELINIREDDPKYFGLQLDGETER